MRHPLIGITCGHRAENPSEIGILADYVRAVADAGGTPAVLPPADSVRNRSRLMQSFDGFVLTGGGDIAPDISGCLARHARHIDRERDLFEIALVCAARRARKPLLGLCKGAQLLNVAFGGTLVGDIPSERPSAVRHGNAEHEIAVVRPSRLGDIFLRTGLTVNSTHHQAVLKAGKGLRITAVAPDGIVEAIEGPPGAHFMIGVQFHPERLCRKDPVFAKLFRAFVKNC